MFNMFKGYNVMDLEKVLKELNKSYEELNKVSEGFMDNKTFKVSSNTIFGISEDDLNKLIDARLKNFKPEVKIPQEAINKAVKKYFDEFVFIDENTKEKCDTYDIIRKFAMDTIGVTENGKLNPEFVNIVRDEIANILGKEVVKEDIDDCQPDEDTFCEDDKYEEADPDDDRISIDDVNKLLRMAKLVIYTDENGELRIAKLPRENNYK